MRPQRLDMNQLAHRVVQRATADRDDDGLDAEDDGDEDGVQTPSPRPDEQLRDDSEASASNLPTTRTPSSMIIGDRREPHLSTPKPDGRAHNDERRTGDRLSPQAVQNLR